LFVATVSPEHKEEVQDLISQEISVEL